MKKIIFYFVFALAVILVAAAIVWAACTPTILTYSVRTDSTFTPLPVPLPSMGGSTGANTCLTQTGYATLICRATDINLLASNIANQQQFSSCCGGFADINTWNFGSTRFLVSTAGGGEVLMDWNASTHTATSEFGANILNNNGSQWSFSNANLLYGVGNGTKVDPIIQTQTFNGTQTQPTPVTLADLATAPNCVPSLANATQYKELAISQSETRFVFGASGTGGQGTGIWVIVWDTTQGCRWLNINTGQIGGNWGPAGAAVVSGASSPFPYTFHSVRMSLDGNTVLVGPSGNQPNRFYWNVGTLSFQAAPKTNNGHYAVGFNGIVTNISHTGQSTWCKYGQILTSFSTFTSTYIIPTAAACFDTHTFGDDHQSWNDDDCSDQQPFFDTTITVPGGTAPSVAWENEVLGFSVNPPGTVWRFAATYNTGNNFSFNCQIAVGTVSQDGKFMTLTSDWGNTLGLDSQGRNRCDTFVLSLNPSGSTPPPVNAPSGLVVTQPGLLAVNRKRGCQISPAGK